MLHVYCRVNHNNAVIVFPVITFKNLLLCTLESHSSVFVVVVWKLTL